jgi:hypothetical protein
MIFSAPETVGDNAIACAVDGCVQAVYRRMRRDNGAFASSLRAKRSMSVLNFPRMSDQ